MVDEPDIFWAVIISMYLGNLVLLILNLPLIPYIAKILADLDAIDKIILVEIIRDIAIHNVFKLGAILQIIHHEHLFNTALV